MKPVIIFLFGLAAYAQGFSLREQVRLKARASCSPGNRYPLDEAIECFRNAYTIPRQDASQCLTSTAQIYQELYVFTPLCNNPAAAPNRNALGYGIFSTRAPLVPALRNVANRLGGDHVSVWDVLTAYNGIFISQRDTHVNPGGVSDDNYAGPVFNGAFSSSTLFLARGPSEYTKFQPKVIDGSVKGVTQDGRIIDTIDGKLVTEYVKELVTSDVLYLKVKSVGVRMNKWFQQQQASASMIGNPDNLKSVKVVFSDGTEETWSWYVLYGETLTNEQVNIHGVFYEGLQSALKFLGNATGVKINNNKSWKPILRSMKKNPVGTSPVIKSSLLQDEAEDVSSFNFEKTFEDGAWGCDKSAGYCVWKLTSFGLSAEVYYQNWLELEAKAKEEQITKLIYDVNGNGGGNVQTGYVGVRALFPTLSKEEMCNSYNRKVGPLAQRYTRLGLDFPTITNTFNTGALSQANFESIFTKRTKNCDDFHADLEMVKGILGALKDLLYINQQTKSMNQRLYNLLVESFDFDHLDQGVDELLKACQSGESSSSLFDELVSRMKNGVLQTHPWQLAEDPAAYTKLVRMSMGGRQNAFFTQKYVIDSCPAAFDPEFKFPYQKSSFSQVRFAGDGTCGSTCDTMTMSTYLSTKTNPNLGVDVKYVTWGGDGNPKTVGSLTGTSFPGGNVYNEDVLTRVWFNFAMMVSLKKMTNSPSLDGVFSLQERIPRYPMCNTKYTPSYTQSQIFHKQFGPRALPSEYVSVPTDLYMQEWYLGSINKEYYEAVSKYF